MVPVVAFIGHHESGKTIFLTRLIPILVERGYRVGTVKHAPQEEAFDRPDKDSSRHRAAGAEQTLLVGETGCALFWDDVTGEPIEGMVERLFADYDIVIAEGLKHGPFPKIEVYRRLDARVEPLAGEIDVVAVVTREHVALPDGVRVFSPRHPEEVADFIEERFL
jgi:molybdopterin-guanine dinucleotide biosynthesis protein MobB